MSDAVQQCVKQCSEVMDALCSPEMRASMEIYAAEKIQSVLAEESRCRAILDDYAADRGALAEIRTELTEAHGGE